MSTPRTDIYELRLKIRGNLRRWTEKFCLGTGSYGALELTSLYLAKGRRLILAKNYTVFDVALHNLGNVRDRYPISGAAGGPINLDTEAGPPVAIEEGNNVNACINVEFGTATGKWNTRQFRGVRDTWITDDTVQITPTSYAIGTPPVLADFDAGQTAEAAFGHFLRAVGNIDRLKVWDPLAVDPSYDLVPWTRYNVKGVSTRDTGVGRDYRGRAAG